MRAVPELPLPSPTSAKETSQSFSFSKQGNLAMDLVTQTAPIHFLGKLLEIYLLPVETQSRLPSA
jgi:hypothetical protein